jgi:hypothetical protein
MAFDVQAAMRAAGINPDEIAPEHRQLVMNDLLSRSQNDPAFAQAMIQERAKTAAGRPAAAANPGPQQPAVANPPQPARRPTQRFPLSPMASSVNAASAIPAQQARQAAGVYGDVMSAFDKENYSRVAQSREARRMQHEKDKEAARMQHEKDVLLMRLRAMRGE